MPDNKPSRVMEILPIVVVVGAACITAIALFSETSAPPSDSGLPVTAEYSADHLMRVDPALVLFQNIRSLPTGTVAPSSIAVTPDGEVFVGTRDGVYAWSPSKKAFLQSIAADSPVRCIDALSKSDIAYATDTHAYIADAGAPPRFTHAFEGDAHVTSIALTDTHLAFADANARLVTVIEIDTGARTSIGARDAKRKIPGFVIPSPHFDLAMGPDGLLRIVNPGLHRIESYTLTGDLEWWWGKSGSATEGFSGCCNPTDIAIFPDGRVVTAEKGILRVKLYSPEGKLIGVIATPDEFSPETKSLDIDVSADGHVFILDPIRNKVCVYAEK